MIITRGDTHSYKFQRLDGEKQPIEEQAPSIYFTVKDSNNEKEIIFQKTIEDMTFDENYFYHFTIWPEDTNDMYYGSYDYDIEVKYTDGNYVRTIAKGKFIVEEETTWKANEV